jgi:excisionase family DNA binding protein
MPNRSALRQPITFDRGRTPTIDEVELLTIDEVATLFRISRRKVYYLIAAGNLPTTPVGVRGTRVRKAAAAAYLLRREREGR